MPVEFVTCSVELWDECEWMNELMNEEACEGKRSWPGSVLAKYPIVYLQKPRNLWKTAYLGLLFLIPINYGKHKPNFF